jgi:hypothetical protein
MERALAALVRTDSVPWELLEDAAEAGHAPPWDGFLPALVHLALWLLLAPLRAAAAAELRDVELGRRAGRAGRAAAASPSSLSSAVPLGAGPQLRGRAVRLLEACFRVGAASHEPIARAAMALATADPAAMAAGAAPAALPWPRPRPRPRPRDASSGEVGGGAPGLGTDPRGGLLARWGGPLLAEVVAVGDAAAGLLAACAAISPAALAPLAPWLSEAALSLATARGGGVASGGGVGDRAGGSGFGCDGSVPASAGWSPNRIELLFEALAQIAKCSAPTTQV